MNIKNIQIDYLCNQPRFIEQVARYIWDYWSEDYSELTNITSLDKMINYYRSANSTLYPIVYVIFSDTILIGTIMVDKEDMGLYTHLSPWLANVFIVPEYRNSGYASLLINHVIKNHKILYLWTYNDRYAEFYSRFGFKILDIVKKHGKYENIIVMYRNI
jgi:GNAT superfamily N-acetyltransferase